ncbi:MAG: alpha-amylase family glycosyl hydrolase [Gemmatimonadaceae bacterium]|nr:alpha-amylase family glycosyl hydrolase [Gemmatimonadaceae bacterium]
MTRAAFTGRLARLALCAAMPLGAQAPTVTKVDPPDWWPQSTVNPVRVMLRGSHLAGASLECGALRCGRVQVNAAGTYVFVDVTIPPSARPGQYPLTVRTPAGRAIAPFELTPKLASAGRYQGFGPSDVMYLLMPDRFANGDPQNDNPVASPGLHNRSERRYYHGGDLAGVRQRLPYLRSLGVSAVWLNPIYDNHNALNDREKPDGKPITDYHGYGPTDFYGVEEHFGTLGEFRALVDAAHAAGIKIVVDMVANHTGPYHPWVTDSPTPTWYHGTVDRHLNNVWQTWTIADRYSPASVRAATLDGWFIDILPDLNQDDPEVARYLIQNTLWWVARTGVDGIRQDTWPYVPRTFWRAWMAAITREFPSLKVVGEVYDGDPALVSFFEGGRAQWDGLDTKVDMLFDFPLFYPIRQAFARGGSLRDVAQMLGRDRMYQDATRLVPFLGLHDVGRFMSEPGATHAGLRLAYTFLLTTRGTPLVYYGDEIGMTGSGDPDNRGDFPGGWPGDAADKFEANGRTPEEQRTWQHLQRLIGLRRARADLQGRAMENVVVTPQQWVYRRGAMLVALNNDTTASTVRVPYGALGSDLLSQCAAPRVDGNQIAVVIPARSGCVFEITRVSIPGPPLGITGRRVLHAGFAATRIAARNVEVWLPPGYDASGSTRYPVLYMHDGQNVFNPATSMGGVDWGVDETMTSLIADGTIRPAIVVATWNSPKRYQEYMPRKALPAGETSFSTGLGRPAASGEIISDAYLAFLVTELKPFIDRTYRTRPGRDDTMVMGSSMGGLISLYAMSEYPNVFGAAAALSTHWPAADGAVIEYLAQHLPPPTTHRLYMDRGSATLDASYPPYQVRADAMARARGYVEGPRFTTRVFEGADHSERAWRERLTIPLTFLLGRR